MYGLETPRNPNWQTLRGFWAWVLVAVAGWPSSTVPPPGPVLPRQAGTGRASPRETRPEPERSKRERNRVVGRLLLVGAAVAAVLAAFWLFWALLWTEWPQFWVALVFAALAVLLLWIRGQWVASARSAG